MEPIKGVLEYDEIDREQGVERTYLYYKRDSLFITTEKQDVDIIESSVWGKMLFLDHVLQTTTRDEVIYHNALVHPLMSSLNKRDKILILGGGEGATAREVLRWDVSNVIMIDYDRELVECMKKHGNDWSKGSFNDRRLIVIYDDAWKYMENTNISYDAVIIDLTDPDYTRQRWISLLTMTLNSVKESCGGIVMNAGHYCPWNTAKLKKVKAIVEELCTVNKDYKYYIYTAYIPSFNGEWTFIAISHISKFMMEPEHLDVIPAWIRRSILTLQNRMIDISASTLPSLQKIKNVTV